MLTSTASKAATANTQVFPVPAFACTIKSAPYLASGIARTCIGEGLSKPASLKFSTSHVGKPNSSNVTSSSPDDVTSDDLNRLPELRPTLARFAMLIGAQLTHNLHSILKTDSFPKNYTNFKSTSSLKRLNFSPIKNPNLLWFYDPLEMNGYKGPSGLEGEKPRMH